VCVLARIFQSEEFLSLFRNVHRYLANFFYKLLQNIIFCLSNINCSKQYFGDNNHFVSEDVWWYLFKNIIMKQFMIYNFSNIENLISANYLIIYYLFVVRLLPTTRKCSMRMLRWSMWKFITEFLRVTHEINFFMFLKRRIFSFPSNFFRKFLKYSILILNFQK